MKTPRVSVIVPVYNAEKYLHRCVDSILAQTFTDFELLLIDDGSKDGSGAICDEYSATDSRVRVSHKPNGGVSSARNLGLDNAEGEWIVFCDADDYVYPEWLANYDFDHADGAQLLQQGADCDRPNFMENGVMSFRLRMEYSGDSVGFMNALDQWKATGYLWIKAFRNEVISAYGIKFDENMNYREDEIFILQYLSKIKLVKSVGSSGYFYRVPEWESKYHMDFDQVVKLYELRYESLSKLNNFERLTIFKSCCSDLTDSYIKKLSFKKGNKALLTRLRTVILKSFHIHPMKNILKRFILRCPLDFLTVIILKTYLRLRLLKDGSTD